MYQEASRIIEAVYNKKGTTKSLCLSSQWRNKKQMYALVCETLKYTTVIDEILTKTKLLRAEKKLKDDQNLARVMVYDFLFGKGADSTKGQLCVLRDHRNSLRTELARIKIRAGVSRNEDLLPDDVKTAGQTLPRYVRVNTLRTDPDTVISQFISEGYTMKQRNDGPDKLARREFVKDEHVPALLVFPPGTDLHDHSLYRDGSIILQDKASCFPAWLLAPTPGSTVVDCCAAPGNKTTHAAAIMMNQGKIFAFDLDPKRAKTMQSLCDRAGTTNVTVTCGDFLAVKTDDVTYNDVQFAIVDPSCSGSGIASRLNDLTDDEKSKSDERIERLSEFQTKIVNHALTFPNLRRLVYFTCSVHARENEHVVEQILAQNSNFDLVSVLPEWTHRGLEDFSFGQKCLRAGPEDFTNGFFVAVFENKKFVNSVPTATNSVNEGVENPGKRKRKGLSRSERRKRKRDKSDP